MNAMNTSDWRIVTTPTFDWLAEYAKACNSQVLIGSPYVNDGIFGLTNLIGKGVSCTLITRTDLRDFAVGASNLDTLCTLAQSGMTILRLNRLHAKVYIFDDASALVTSANATFSGLGRNLECGLGTSDKLVIEQLTQSLLMGFGSTSAPKITSSSELEALQAPLKTIKASLPETPRTTSSNPCTDAIEAEFSISDKEVFLESFSGWNKLTLCGVLAMQEDRFDLQELYDACEPTAAKEYPSNRNVRPKVRQQLQMLRDIGLVEFVTPGHYRRTIK